MQKINVKIHAVGSASDNILHAVGNLNSGKTDFSPRDFEGWVIFEKSYLPNSRKGLTIVKDNEEPNTYHVSEDGGKTFTMSLEWVEIYNLPEVDKDIETELSRADDLKDVFN